MLTHEVRKLTGTCQLLKQRVVEAEAAAALSEAAATMGSPVMVRKSDAGVQVLLDAPSPVTVSLGLATGRGLSAITTCSGKGGHHFGPALTRRPAGGLRPRSHPGRRKSIWPAWEQRALERGISQAKPHTDMDSGTAHLSMLRSPKRQVDRAAHAGRGAEYT